MIVVYDDAGYGAEFHHFTDADHATVRFPDTDLAAVAAGRLGEGRGGLLCAGWVCGGEAGGGAGERQGAPERGGERTGGHGIGLMEA